MREVNKVKKLVKLDTVDKEIINEINIRFGCLLNGQSYKEFEHCHCDTNFYGSVDELLKIMPEGWRLHSIKHTKSGYRSTLFNDEENAICSGTLFHAKAAPALLLNILRLKERG